MFLATETKINIETGLNFIKDTINYSATKDLIWFVDKDFDYVDTLYLVFPGCKIFLCSVHVYRYTYMSERKFFLPLGMMILVRYSKLK